MEALKIEATDYSPKINLNHITNEYSIIGESRPENARKFYEPILAWFTEAFNHFYFLNSKSGGVNAPKVLVINLDYFNSTSAKLLYDLMAQLKEGKEKFNVEFAVDWHYHYLDEDMLESGKEMERLTQLKFNYIEKK
jgi:hypothetical protein